MGRRNNSKLQKEKDKVACAKSYRKYRAKRITESRAWALANPEKAKANSKKSTAKYLKKYPERRKETYRKSRIKRCSYISTSIRSALFNQGVKKNSKTVALLSIPIEEFQAVMEKLFWPGMSWKNKHKWQLDHIRPCADFDLTDPEQQKQCFHWSNWQPLWADDNGIKSDRLDWTPHESRHSLPERLKPEPFVFI